MKYSIKQIGNQFQVIAYDRFSALTVFAGDYAQCEAYLQGIRQRYSS